MHVTSINLALILWGILQMNAPIGQSKIALGAKDLDPGLQTALQASSGVMGTSRLAESRPNGVPCFVLTRNGCREVVEN